MDTKNKLIPLISKHIILIITIVSLITYAFLYMYIDKSSVPPIHSDGEGYYVYLPSYLIYRDPTMKKIAGKRFDQNPHLLSLAGMSRIPSTGVFLDKYNIGEAVLLLPFFLLGHILSIIFSYPVNGYSFFYQYSVGVAGLFYMVFGLFFLKKTMERYFIDKITLVTLLVMTFATSLFNYGTFDSIFSHVFSFFLFSIFIFFIPEWYSKPGSYKNSVLLGIIAGLIPLVRIPNGLVLVVFPLYGINITGVRERFTFFIKNIRYLLIICIVSVLVFIPQLLIWKYTTNKWIIMPYGNEGFNFSSPHILDALFSVRRGLFFWSPVLVFSIIGLGYLAKRSREFFIPILVFLPLNLYIIASWGNWWFGVGFGHRAFVDSYALLALPLASFYDATLRNKYKLVKFAVTVLTILCVVLSLLTMVQYWRGDIPYDKTTWDIYLRAIFLSNKFNPFLPDEGYKALISFPYKEIVTNEKNIQLPVTLENASPVEWPKDISKTLKYTINMSYRWLSASHRPISGFEPRIPLPHDIRPRESVHFNLKINIPYKPGTYFLEFDMVQENVTWFRYKGSPTSTIKIVVK